MKMSKENKAEEILDKHLEFRSLTKTIPKHGNLYNTLLNVVNEALNVPRNETCAHNEEVELVSHAAKCKECGTVFETKW